MASGLDGSVCGVDAELKQLAPDSLKDIRPGLVPGIFLSVLTDELLKGNSLREDS
ncbi:hypothetical protein AGR7B_pAt0245 [Agrobacterium deltaense RV3]|nr:hypothetical protein AGR7B_pAt0245 [Agrobacterium deltaense RV3]